MTSAGKIVVLRDETVLAEINGEIRKFADTTSFRQKTGNLDELWDEISDDSRKAEFRSIFQAHVY